MKQSTGKDYELKLEIDFNYLPPGPEDAVHGQCCSGGVVLHANNGKIRCINTLDERLDAVLDTNTPSLRNLLFS